jgi:heterodisulfide reductase subunit A
MNDQIKTVSRTRGAVLIVGAGIGGMQAALDLANGGFKVHIIQEDSSIGGTMVMLDKTFPTGDCAMCMISPKMVEVGRHPNIRIHTLTEVIALEGQAGNFTAHIKQHPRYVDADKCTGCGVCEDKCPRLVSSQFQQGLSKRRAIYTMLSQAVPNTRAIDQEHCIYLQRNRCRACEKFCDAGAINFNDTEKVSELNVGAVILSPGLARYDPRERQELGFLRWGSVVTSIQFERILSATGPYAAEVKRPGDEKHPRKIAWLQCVGSRDPHNANPWCSSVCCMYATKQAVIAKEHDPDVEPTIFYMEMRAFGKDFDKYVERAKNEYGVRYIRAMISDVKDVYDTGDIILRYARPDGVLVDETFNLLVLSIGFELHPNAKELAQNMGIGCDTYGFPRVSPFEPSATDRPGVFVAGTFQNPKDIPETVIQGSAVAGSVMALLSDSRGTEVAVKTLSPERDVKTDDIRIGVQVCRCGVNIAQTVDVLAVVDAVKDLPGVVHAEDTIFACAQDGQERIKNLIREKNLNRVVVASCTPRTHEPLFQDTVREAGLNKYLFELADIREQCAWCHMRQNKIATKKAIGIVKMSIAKARRLAPVDIDTVNVTPAAMIIGGGVAGITAALCLAEQGFDIHLVEKEKELGGLVNQLLHTLDGSDVQQFIHKQIDAVEAHPRITVYVNAQVRHSDGFVGNFKTVLTDGAEIEHGIVLIATGGGEYQPDEYAYHQSERIITQRALEKKLAHEQALADEHYVMIQCVGSREEPHNVCSRICCQDAVKNAIAIKKHTPDAQVTILYRDIRTYGLRERFYAQARDLGVLFMRFETDRKPQVTVNSSGIKVNAFDYLLDRDIEMDADFVVLSTGLRPHPSAEKIGKMYKLTRNADGYFMEAHIKLRPVDFPSEGLFIAGLAHAPKNLDETISQAQAAAGRAGALLSQERLTVSGIIAKHDRDRCMSCLACFRACPYDSPFIDKDGKISHNEIKCTGCGICAGVCPAKAFQVNSFRDEQILAMIDEVV